MTDVRTVAHDRMLKVTTVCARTGYIAATPPKNFRIARSTYWVFKTRLPSRETRRECLGRTCRKAMWQVWQHMGPDRCASTAHKLAVLFKETQQHKGLTLTAASSDAAIQALL